MLNLYMAKKLTTNEFIKKAQARHGDKYDYSNTIYVSMFKKVRIDCKLHGAFIQTAHDHVYGNGCKTCGYISNTNKSKFTTDSFIEKAKQIHGSKYDYGFVCYNSIKSEVRIKCYKHGIFEQTPNDHLHKASGCPKCKSSKGEKSIHRLLEHLGLDYIINHKFHDCRNDKNNLLFFDIYLPAYNTVIEYDGEQHFLYRKTGYFKNKLEQNLKNDLIKDEFCIKNNIKLIRIPYTEYVNIEKILRKEYLSGFCRSLNLSKEIRSIPIYTYE